MMIRLHVCIRRCMTRMPLTSKSGWRPHIMVREQGQVVIEHQTWEFRRGWTIFSTVGLVWADNEPLKDGDVSFGRNVSAARNQERGGLNNEVLKYCSDDLSNRKL
ncbi:hypothetical protein VPH35_056856 [Triticum aestivum]